MTERIFFLFGICGLYYKHILTSVSDDPKWHLYYKCVIDDASLVS
jgi:hypothetical protein